MLDKLLNSTKPLEKALNASLTRNEVIAQNIANVDTPNYKRKSVEFEEMLNDAISGRKITGRMTNKKHIPIGSSINNIEPRIQEDNQDLSVRLDGNNVDIEREMALMAKNTIKYNTLIQRISGQFKKINSVIIGGG